MYVLILLFLIVAFLQIRKEYIQKNKQLESIQQSSQVQTMNQVQNQTHAQNQVQTQTQTQTHAQNQVQAQAQNQNGAQINKNVPSGIGASDLPRSENATLEESSGLKSVESELCKNPMNTLFSGVLTDAQIDAYRRGIGEVGPYDATKKQNDDKNFNGVLLEGFEFNPEMDKVKPRVSDDSEFLGQRINKGFSNDFSYLGQNTVATGFSNNFLFQRHADHLFTEKYKDFALLIDESDKLENTMNRDIIKNIQYRNPLSQAFFGEDNLNRLQQEIIDEVARRSKGLYKISRQSDNELFVVMRSIYLQYAQNLPDDIEAQVCQLNKLVMLWAVPKILVNVEQHLGYIRDQGEMHRVLPRPEFISAAGTRTNRSFTSLFI